MRREPPKRRRNVRWTAEEYKDLAHTIWSMRKNDPTAPLVTLAQRAVAQMPQDRKRKITAASQIQPIVEELKLLDTKYHAAFAEVPRLESSVKSLRESSFTKEEILETLTDDEILIYFGDKVSRLLSPEQILSKMDYDDILTSVPLEKVAGYVAESVVGKLISFEESEIEEVPTPASSTSKPTATKDNRPSCLVVGALSRQHSNITARLKRLAKVSFLRKDQAVPPAGYDYYLIWLDFVTHGMCDAVAAHTPKDQIVSYKGGLSKMDEALSRAIKRNSR